MIPLLMTYNPYIESNTSLLTTQIEDLSSFTKRNEHYEKESNFIIGSLSPFTASVIDNVLTLDYSIQTYNPTEEDIDDYMSLSLGVISKKVISKKTIISSVRKFKPKLVI